MTRLLYLIAEDSYFISHRLELALYAKQQGFEVAIATKCVKHRDEILQQGLQLFELKFFNRSNYLNVFKEILALKELYLVYKKFKPDIVHQVALKPIVYGTIIARILKVPKIINALAGLGFVFT
ncbi:MAG: glycosyltransferase [Gammaproteobacteria bacterium]